MMKSGTTTKQEKNSMVCALDKPEGSGVKWPVQSRQTPEPIATPKKNRIEEWKAAIDGSNQCWAAEVEQRESSKGKQAGTKTIRNSFDISKLSNVGKIKKPDKEPMSEVEQEIIPAPPKSTDDVMVSVGGTAATPPPTRNGPDKQRNGAKSQK
ncbi:hypothetical protein K7X08_016558 [Anisodus acutangulus]|uniref:Uncharacterized protein n=1 Tax=Anisodus acutangulus TaxID=402998 RepID=A0A9Q1R0Y1_9SOLA|nr:hypothetical protein K7X08_016558 [Anisodus acutangulus]